LNLIANDLTSISPAIGYIISLQALYLDSNRLAGEHPPTLGNLRNLITLDVANNDLTESIPDTFRGLSSLQQLIVVGNSFEGSLPDFLDRTAIKYSENASLARRQTLDFVSTSIGK
jgi:Leucine-rich repeat (LRR) protein